MYSITTEELVPKLLPWNKVMADSKSRWYTPKSGRELYVSDLNVTKPINAHFTAPVDYGNFCILQKSSRYEDDVVHALHEMAKMIVVQIKTVLFWRKSQCR